MIAGRQDSKYVNPPIIYAHRKYHHRTQSVSFCAAPAVCTVRPGFNGLHQTLCGIIQGQGRAAGRPLPQCRLAVQRRKRANPPDSRRIRGKHTWLNL
eukprot:scaffold187854_cov21-Prasinocladus_malaysianus.AAC.1